MAWAKGITDVVPMHGLGTTPCLVDRHTGVVYTNPQIWPLLSQPTKAFFLLHEWGHLARQTFSETEADSFAFNIFIKQGFKPELAATALRTIPNWYNDNQIINRVRLLEAKAQQHR